MNIVFFGSSQFAVPALKALIKSGHKIPCVVTQPDRKKGRGLHLSTTEVKMVAEDASLKIYQPANINSPEAVNYLKSLLPDLFVVVAYGQILSQEVLDIPKIFSINIHASLLPKYRGAAPINRAIIRGEKNTGITIIKLVKEMDAGPIILQKSIDIEELDTAFNLEEKLAKMGAGLLPETLKAIENNKYELKAQDERGVSLAPKLKKEDARIDWEKPAREIYNLIRGCFLKPGAFTYYQGRLLKIYKAETSPCVHSIAGAPGEIAQVSKDGLVVVTGEGNLTIKELQIEGKRRMTVEDFIAGHKIKIGERLG